MLRKIVATLLLLVLVLVVVVALQPDDFRIERSTSVAAPPPVVYALITDFHHWDLWSPWAKLDPSMKKQYGGPPHGKGATYEWAGNDHVGEGRMEITDVRDDREVTIDLAFIAPFEAHNTALFTLEPQPEASTRVTWAMLGKNGFLSKAFGLFMDVDAMLGKDFERGLADLKRAAEQRARPTE
ncbi:MAG: SRPBCC family protein [Polyangiales bacterium]